MATSPLQDHVLEYLFHRPLSRVARRDHLQYRTHQRPHITATVHRVHFTDGSRQSSMAVYDTFTESVHHYHYSPPNAERGWKKNHPR